MINTKKEYLPSLRKYLQKKTDYLGHTNGLPFYDLFAPIGKTSKTYTYEECQKIVNEHFGSFSKELADLSKKAFDAHWIDVDPRKGTRGNAFCNNQHQINECRILTNFTGSFSCVTTIAHELGHAYHNTQISSNSPLNWKYTVPVAEAASIFCETIVTNNILKDLDSEGRLSVLEQNLNDHTQIIVDILSRYLFEERVLAKADEGNISPDQFKELMIEVQKDTYGEALDSEYLHPYMWINNSHYYNPNLHFYNFPHAFGLLFSKGLYSIYLDNKESFVSKYNEMLKATGKGSVEDVASMMDIDVTNKEFWKSSLDIICEDIEEFCELVDGLL